MHQVENTLLSIYFNIEMIVDVFLARPISGFITHPQKQRSLPFHPRKMFSMIEKMYGVSHSSVVLIRSVEAAELV